MNADNQVTAIAAIMVLPKVEITKVNIILIEFVLAFLNPKLLFHFNCMKEFSQK